MYIAAAAILHNTKLDRYHPIIYRDAPMPGPEPSIRRLRSLGHHTTGFDTLEEAKASLTDNQEMTIEHMIDQIGEWDGEDLPIDTIFV